MLSSPLRASITVSRFGSSAMYIMAMFTIDRIDKIPTKISYPVFFNSLWFVSTLTMTPLSSIVSPCAASQPHSRWVNFEIVSRFLWFSTFWQSDVDDLDQLVESGDDGLDVGVAGVNDRSIRLCIRPVPYCFHGVARMGAEYSA